MTLIVTLDELRGLGGRDLGHTDFREMTQQRVDAFAETTGDHQWIHTDPERARSGPFGGTIAHGALTLSLVIPLWAELIAVSDATAGINYGLDRVRFVSPVRVGSRIRLSATVDSVTEVTGGLQVVTDQTVEIEGAEKPALVARSLYRFFE